MGSLTWVIVNKKSYQKDQVNEKFTMELSKEVHGLLDRIKRLSNAQKTPVNSYPYDNTKTFPPSEEIDFNPEDILTLDDFDVSDRETW